MSQNNNHNNHTSRLIQSISALTTSGRLMSTNTTAAASSSNGSKFHHIEVAPPDEIFNTAAKYKADTDERKVDLGIGAYRTDEGKPLVLNVVRKAEKIISENKSLNKEYLPIDGDATFVKTARSLLLGADSSALKDDRVASVQSLSGTGALRVGSEFIAKHLPKDTSIYYSTPTWGNHPAIFRNAGVAYKQYRYWDQSGRKLDIDGMLEDIRNAPNNSIILLHACAHNPTGVDPSQDEWKRIASVIREKNHLPFFDSAYQGFASGDLERDAWAVRYFIDQGFELFVAQSFAKNFGLYNERVGTLSVVTKSKDVAKAVLSQLKLVARPSYSNPPAHGARIVSTVLNDKGLTSEWHDELRGMSGRIQKMRDALRGELERLGTPGTWRHITDQIGMFSYTGLTKEQCKYLTEKHHIYLLTNGRISMAGINSNNVKYVAKAIDDAVKNIKN